MNKEAVIAAEAAHYVPVFSRYPIVLERGEGCTVYDADGKAYIAFLAGIAVNALGHAHPKLVKAIADQAAADLMANDERTRGSLISLAQSGIDVGTAASQALNGLAANAAQARSDTAGATVGDLFGSMGQAYLMNQMRKGMQAGQGQQGQQWFGVSNTRSGDQGNVT